MPLVDKWWGFVTASLRLHEWLNESGCRCPCTLTLKQGKVRAESGVLPPFEPCLLRSGLDSQAGLPQAKGNGGAGRTLASHVRLSQQTGLTESILPPIEPIGCHADVELSTHPKSPLHGHSPGLLSLRHV